MQGLLASLDGAQTWGKYKAIMQMLVLTIGTQRRRLLWDAVLLLQDTVRKRKEASTVCQTLMLAYQGPLGLTKLSPPENGCETGNLIRKQMDPKSKRCPVSSMPSFMILSVSNFSSAGFLSLLCYFPVQSLTLLLSGKTRPYFRFNLKWSPYLLAKIYLFM